LIEFEDTLDDFEGFDGDLVVREWV